MSFRSLRRLFPGSRTRPESCRRRPRPPRLLLEELESRLVPYIALPGPVTGVPAENNDCDPMAAVGSEAKGADACLPSRKSVLFLG